MVPVFRRFAYRGVDLVVIPQPDGSIACIPEWMTNEYAARFALTPEPQFSLDNLRALRAEVDALLTILPSDSTREKGGHEAQKSENREPTSNSVRTGAPPIDLPATQRAQLAKLFEALFVEIAAAHVTGEDSDEQDHR